LAGTLSVLTDVSVVFLSISRQNLGYYTTGTQPLPAKRVPIHNPPNVTNASYISNSALLGSETMKFCVYSWYMQVNLTGRNG